MLRLIMKRLFYIYLVAAIACVSFHSCLFQEDDLFDDSAANRVTNANNRYAALLQSATNGWVMEYYIGDDYSSGGISILCKFTDKEVEMASTCSVPGADAGTVHSSLYKLIGEQGPMLTFDSYNPVMHYFATPTGGGSDPNGTLGGDYEFVIRSATDTQIVLEGKKVGNTMVMTRLADDVKWSDYIDKVTTMEENAFLNTYEVKEGGQVVGMLQRNNYTFTMTDALGDVIYDLMPFVYTETGLKFREPFVINGTSVQYLEWNEASRTLVSTDGAVSFEGIYPEGWRSYEEFLGNYVLSYGNERSNVVLEEKDYNHSFTMKGLPQFDVEVTYNQGEGRIEIMYQYLGTYQGYEIWLCPWDAASGYLTWSPEVGLVGVEERANPLTISFVENGAWPDYNADSFLFYAFSGTPGSSTAVSSVLQVPNPVLTKQ